MPIREECKNYQSRTYSTGEVTRLCVLNLAPEAPWRCPDNCPAYARRLADAGWTHGTLVSPPLEEEPDGENVGDVLNEAEDIVNAIVSETREQVSADREAEGDSATRRLRRLFRRNDPKSEQ